MSLKFDRRRLLVVGSASVMTNVVIGSFSALPAFRFREQTFGSMTVKPELAGVKACVFDTFGTVVDWRSSVIAEATNRGNAKGLNVNWAEFADHWRLGYKPAMDKVRNGEIPWTNLDEL